LISINVAEFDVRFF